MENKKQEIASRMSLFLRMIFSASDTLGIAIATSKTGDIILIDNETGISKTYSPTELHEVFEKWLINKNSR